MRRYGLVGYPLSHSFSRNYFAEKFAREGLVDCVYENFPIPAISAFQDLLQTPDLRGLNVTIPYKRDVLPFLDEMTYGVAEMGACNCIDIRDGKLTGHNTDVYGFQRSLMPFLHSRHTRALILGTGGASSAVAFVLKQLQVNYQFVSRKAENGNIGYADVDKQMIQDCLLIINTTPLGMYPKTDESPDIPYEHVTPDHHLFDLVYNPEETLFLSKGKAQGATVQNGYEMLVLQAEESWRIWND